MVIGAIPRMGKTFALRALAWEWREWCEFSYIVDPDAFFGQHADYLMSVLLQPEEASICARASSAVPSLGTRSRCSSPASAPCSRTGGAATR